MSEKPQDTEEYYAVAHSETINNQLIRTYTITKLSLDRIKNAPHQQDIEKLRNELNEFRTLLQPLLVKAMKEELLKAMDNQAHFLKTLLERIPNSNLYGYDIGFEALRELAAEKKIIDTKGHGWKKQK